MVCRAAGVDPDSQEAYELASSGFLRPLDSAAGPVIYGMKCIQFAPPTFTLGRFSMVYIYSSV